MVVGILVGLYFPDFARWCEPFTGWIIVLIKNLAIPLLFLAIFDTVLQADFAGKGVLQLAALSAFNAVAATTIAIGLAGWLQPGRRLPLRDLGASVDTRKFEQLNLIDAVAAFFTSGMVIVIMLALALALIVKYLMPSQAGRIRGQAERGLKLWLRLFGVLLHLVPLAVFSAVAKVIASYGFNLFHGLAWYLFACLLGMVAHVALVYHSWIVFYARIPLLKFWQFAREPVIYAFGVNSSLATLPFTLKALEHLGVRPAAARLSACIGTNFNNDGILLYEVVAALFLAQAYGIELSFFQQIFAALLAVVACIGVGGVPEAGVVALTIVLSTLELPLEGISILLTVDWVIARTRSSVNVLGDMTGGVVLDRSVYARRT